MFSSNVYSEWSSTPFRDHVWTLDLLIIVHRALFRILCVWIWSWMMVALVVDACARGKSTMLVKKTAKSLLLDMPVCRLWMRASLSCCCCVWLFWWEGDGRNVGRLNCVSIRFWHDHTLLPLWHHRNGSEFGLTDKNRHSTLHTNAHKLRCALTCRRLVNGDT